MNIIANIKEEIGEYSPVSIQLSSTSTILILLVLNIPERILTNTGASIPQTNQNIHRYKIVEIDLNTGEQINNPLEFEDEYNYHFIEKIKSNYLLVGARCKYYTKTKQDKNAIIVNTNADIENRLTIGDGVERILVTNDKIWASYFDEGIFGNLGWDKPIGQNGITQWSEDGKLEFETISASNKFISDCYALTESTDTTIQFYFYTNFDVGIVNHKKELDYLNCPIEGSHAFITNSRDYIFFGNYDNRTTFFIFERINNTLKQKSEILLDLIDKNFPNFNYGYRKDKFIFLIESDIYILNISDIKTFDNI